MRPSLRIRPLLVVAAAAALVGVASPAAATCTDSTGLCVVSGNVKWKPDNTLTEAQLRKENKKRKGAVANLDLKVDDGRATVFIDGRWGGVAPLTSYPMTPGAHDLQVRDGNRILAEGVLVFTAGESVSIEIRH